MFVRLLFESFRRQRRRKAFALLAIVLGMSLSTAMISVATDIGDKINRELRSVSTNLVLTPMEAGLDVTIGAHTFKPAGEEKAFISESDLPRLKSIFWGHNIVGFAPFLSGQQTFNRPAGPFDAGVIGTYFAQPVQYGKETFTTGVRSVNQFWHVEGEWPTDDGTDALAGVSLAQKAGLKAGDTVELKGQTVLRISGIVTTGGAEDDAIVAPLHLVQKVLGTPGAVRRVAVSALTSRKTLLRAAIPIRCQAPCANAGIARLMRTLLPSRFMRRCPTCRWSRSGKSSRARARCFPAFPA